MEIGDLAGQMAGVQGGAPPERNVRTISVCRSTLHSRYRDEQNGRCRSYRLLTDYGFHHVLLPSSAQRELSACVSVAVGRTPQNISDDEGVSFRTVCKTPHRTRTSVFNPGMQTEQSFIYGRLEQHGAFGSRRKILPRRSRSF